MYRTFIEDLPEPPHPGEILREDILPCLGMTRAALARHLGISARMLGDLLAERRSVDRKMAQRLGIALGQGARYWLGLQVQHDLWHCDIDEPPVKPIRWGKRKKTRQAATRSRPTAAAAGCASL